MALFGAYARGTQTEASDLDFIIDKGKIQGLELLGFINSLEDEFKVHVDVITYQSLKESLFSHDDIDEVILYEG